MHDSDYSNVAVLEAIFFAVAAIPVDSYPNMEMAMIELVENTPMKRKEMRGCIFFPLVATSN